METGPSNNLVFKERPVIISPYPFQNNSLDVVPGFYNTGLVGINLDMPYTLNILETRVEWLFHADRPGFKRGVFIETGNLDVGPEPDHFFTDLFLKPCKNGNGYEHYCHPQGNAQDCDPDYRMRKISFVRR